MQFWTSWQFFAAVLVVFGWAIYGLVGASRQVARHRATQSTPPGKSLTWRVVGYVMFVGAPLMLGVPCLSKQFGLELAGPVTAVLLGFGVLDVLLGGFFLIGADRAAEG